MNDLLWQEIFYIYLDIFYKYYNCNVASHWKRSMFMCNTASKHSYTCYGQNSIASYNTLLSRIWTFSYTRIIQAHRCVLCVYWYLFYSNRVLSKDFLKQISWGKERSTWAVFLLLRVANTILQIAALVRSDSELKDQNYFS